jgi:hypothetical protein
VESCPGLDRCFRCRGQSRDSCDETSEWRLVVNNNILITVLVVLGIIAVVVWLIEAL